MLRTGRNFLVKVNANIGNSAVSSSIEEVRLRRYQDPLLGTFHWLGCDEEVAGI